MGYNGCLIFCQITADEERRVSRRIVVQHPSLFSHNSGLFLRTAFLKRAKTSWYNCLFTIWPRCTNSWGTMPFQSKNTTNITLIFDRLIPAFFGRGLHLGFNIIPTNPRLIFCYDVLKKVFIIICIGKQFLISTRFSFWSSVIKSGTNSALTRRIWSFSVRIWWQDPMLMPTSSATSRTVTRRFPRTLLTLSSFVDVEDRPGLGSSPTDILPSLKRLNHS